jgi:hypothetical protein
MLFDNPSRRGFPELGRLRKKFGMSRVLQPLCCSPSLDLFRPLAAGLFDQRT